MSFMNAVYIPNAMRDECSGKDLLCFWWPIWFLKIFSEWTLKWVDLKYRTHGYTPRSVWCTSRRSLRGWEDTAPRIYRGLPVGIWQMWNRTWRVEFCVTKADIEERSGSMPPPKVVFLGLIYFHVRPGGHPSYTGRSEGSVLWVERIAAQLAPNCSASNLQFLVRSGGWRVEGILLSTCVPQISWTLGLNWYIMLFARQKVEIAWSHPFSMNQGF